MPLVIEAVEKYGRESAFRILRDAERLPQTEFSFNWLLNELKADFDQDNYRFAVCLALLSAATPTITLNFQRRPSLHF